MLLVIAFAQFLYAVPFHASAVGAHMMVFWDPSFGSVPTGWTLITTYDGRFPRGETPANFGLTGGDDVPRTPAVSSITVSSANGTQLSASGSTFSTAALNHTHPAPTVTVGADSSGDIPVFRSLQLIQYTAGVPNGLPAGAIIMFDTSGSIPSGFTRVSAQDDHMLRVNSTVTTGGSDTANNTVAIGALPTSANVVQQSDSRNGSTVALPQHTHTAPPDGTTATVSTVPPYVQPLLAQANATTSTLPPAMTAMFDGDPGVGWSVQSNVGGSYYQQFLRPSATANLTSQGSTTHTPPNYVVESGPADTPSTITQRTNGTGDVSQAHTHTITVAFSATSNLPPYFNVVIAQKISFTLQAYRWYIDNSAVNPTDPWPSGTLDLAQNTMLPAIPAPYRPPTAGDQLRLRVQVQLSGKAMAASSIQFKLQYKQATDGVCTTGSWTDLPLIASGGQWTYGLNGVGDNTAITTSTLTPSSSVLELFSRSAPTAVNPNAASVGQTVEYDFLIKDNAASDGSQFSFRMVESTGTPLSVYSVCPTLVTRPGLSQELRHGEFFQDGSDQGFLWVE